MGRDYDFQLLCRCLCEYKADCAVAVDDIGSRRFIDERDGSRRCGQSGKPFLAVVTDPRFTLDQMFAKFGKTPDYHTIGAEWDSIGISNLDRLTLCAIASNRGGLSTQVEVDQGRIQMTNEEAAVMQAANPSRTD